MTNGIDIHSLELVAPRIEQTFIFSARPCSRRGTESSGSFRDS